MVSLGYYVIQNREGKFFKLNSNFLGPPKFIDDFVDCHKFRSRQLAEDFMKDTYVTKIYKDEFRNCVLRRVNLILT